MADVRRPTASLLTLLASVALLVSQCEGVCCRGITRARRQTCQKSGPGAVHVTRPIARCLIAAGLRPLSVLGTNYYYLGESYATWENARAICQSNGLELASIASQGVSDALHAAVVAAIGDVSYFIGGTDRGSEGSWRWVDGRPWSYSRWVRPGCAPSACPACCQRLS
jgi:hypothetical protein